MKTVINTLILAVICMMLSGCEKNQLSGLNTNLPMDVYSLTVSIKDISGNDLVAILGKESWESAAGSKAYGWINPEFYQLDIILSNSHPTWDSNFYNFRSHTGGLFDPDMIRPDLQMLAYDEEGKIVSTRFNGADDTEGWSFYLFNNFHNPAINGRQDSLTYKILCPKIFGDNLTHEIIAYWRDDSEVERYPDWKDNVNEERYPECISATFEGKEVPVKKMLIFSGPNFDHYGYLLNIVLDK